MSTNKDIAIDRVREVRHKISARFGHDTKRLIDHYIEYQKKFADRLEPTSSSRRASEPKPWAVPPSLRI